MVDKLDEQTTKELNSAFDRMDKAFDRIDKAFDEMSNIINEKLNAELDENINDIKNTIIIKDNWKNIIIERIMYFLLGGIIGYIIQSII